jgi:7,8-dihydroneopterin aldolase/epimerase/oxygenase
MSWTITLEQVEVFARVGILPHERDPQRIWVDVALDVDYDSVPTHIGECADYAVVYNHIQSWADAPHTPLLETLAEELTTFILSMLPQVVAATCYIRKPDIFPRASAVGVRLRVTR